MIDAGIRVPHTNLHFNARPKCVDFVLKVKMPSQCQEVSTACVCQIVLAGNTTAAKLAALHLPEPQLP